MEWKLFKICVILKLKELINFKKKLKKLKILRIKLLISKLYTEMSKLTKLRMRMLSFYKILLMKKSSHIREVQVLINNLNFKITLLKALL